MLLRTWRFLRKEWFLATMLVAIALLITWNAVTLTDQFRGRPNREGKVAYALARLYLTGDVERIGEMARLDVAQQLAAFRQKYPERPYLLFAVDPNGDILVDFESLLGKEIAMVRMTRINGRWIGVETHHWTTGEQRPWWRLPPYEEKWWRVRDQSGRLVE